jgi:hypothetical protein
VQHSAGNIRLEDLDRWLPILVEVVGVAEALHVLLESTPAVMVSEVGYHAFRHFGMDSKVCGVGFGWRSLKELVDSLQIEDFPSLLIQKLLQA